MIQTFPMRDQLTDPTASATPNNNRSEDCVAESIAACIQFWTGKDVSEEDIKAAAYGAGYVGGTSAATYHSKGVDHKYGVDIETVNGTQAQLMAAIKASLDKDIPVLITIPSAWGTVSSANHSNMADPNFGTHCCVAYKYVGDTMDVMNPWIADKGPHVDTIEWWQARLCWGHVYPVTKYPATVPAPAPAPAPTPKPAPAPAPKPAPQPTPQPVPVSAPNPAAALNLANLIAALKGKTASQDVSNALAALIAGLKK